LGLVEPGGFGVLTFAKLAFVLELLWVWWLDRAVESAAQATPVSSLGKKSSAPTHRYE
jgi:hypothetical protein